MHPRYTVVMPRALSWAAICLALVLVAVKAAYLGVPAVAGVGDFLASLMAITYRDVLFAAALWVVGRTALMLAGGRRLPRHIVYNGFVLVSAFLCLYAVASVVAFGVLGGFLTFALIHLVGNLRMLSSSVSVYLTPRVVVGLVCVPLGYIGLVRAVVRWAPAARGPRWRRPALACAALAGWVGVGQYVYATDWATHYDSRIAENPPWVFVVSWWQVFRGERNVRMTDTFDPAYLTDFEPIGRRPAAPVAAPVRALAVRRGGGVVTASRRPPNVILLVLESVAARWTSVSGGLYDTTPTIKAESAHGLLADNFYAHVGRSSNALAAILLSAYPKLDFRDFTEEYPHAVRTSLAEVFRRGGYRTAFLTSSDLQWAGWEDFIKARGFDEVRDFRGLPCDDTHVMSSWGSEDRCLVEGVLQFIQKDPTHPFFVMGWTDQTHHPYEQTPDVPTLDLLKESTPDDYDLGRYLNVLHETDHQLARLFAAVRAAGLADDTLIVLIGDHGQAFGFPHDSYMQGRTIYEEDVHVPLLFWFPRRYVTGRRAPEVGAQVDLAPTIADLAGVPSAPDWQGRSLFDPHRSPRAYFYVAQDEFRLGVREGNWKYILDLRAGTEELYDLAGDPTEQHNLVAAQPERCLRLRQRLAAWTDANHRQYANMVSVGR